MEVLSDIHCFRLNWMPIKMADLDFWEMMNAVELTIERTTEICMKKKWLRNALAVASSPWDQMPGIKN